jgi:hypothetical protein
MLKRILAISCILMASNAYAGKIFSLTHLPGANTEATVTQAGEIDKRHVAKSIAIVFANRHATVDQLVTVEILSGSTRIWAMRFLVQVLSSKEITLSNLELPANEGESLTLHFTGGRSANTIESVALIGETEDDRFQ